LPNSIVKIQLMAKYNILLTVLLLHFVIACTTPTPPAATTSDLKTYFTDNSPEPKSGGVRLIPIKTPKGDFQVWTKRFGNNPTTKVLLLHGGPGCTHEYFESFESFLPQEGIEFIYYDQLGSAYSSQPKDGSLWDLPRFVEEVEQVRTALGLDKNNFYLLGHSWGGILAMEYALKYQQNLKGLIISNMMCDVPKYNDYADQVLAKQMKPEVLKEVLAIEAKEDYKNPRYMELLVPNFYEQHILRRPAAEWPDAVNRTFAKLNSDIYVSMQGPSEFGIRGNASLKNWNVSTKLPSITVPTLVIGATHDTMDPEHMRWMSTQLPKGQFLLCPDGGHMCMWDDQAHYFPGLISFLKQ
jgi:proline iminopeptidase